jgi:hypothetical protein
VAAVYRLRFDPRTSALAELDDWARLVLSRRWPLPWRTRLCGRRLILHYAGVTSDGRVLHSYVSLEPVRGALKARIAPPVSVALLAAAWYTGTLPVIWRGTAALLAPPETAPRYAEEVAWRNPPRVNPRALEAHPRGEPVRVEDVVDMRPGRVKTRWLGPGEPISW